LLTLYSLGIASPSTHIVIFDAHLDARDAERGNRFTHATWLRRFCELATGCSILLLGVRSCSEEELGFAEENKLTYFTPTQLRREKQRVLELVVRFCKAEEIYLSIDMDAFDPSIAPAVRCPEPNGLLWDEFVELIECLRGGKLIGIDLVEVRSLGENRVTEFLAINAIFRVLNLTRHKI
jgi:agmatinase